MDANGFFAGWSLNFHAAVAANGEIKLGNLVILGVIGIKIILAVKFAVTCNGTVGGQPYSDGIIYYLFIQDRQGARHPSAYRAGMGVGSASKGSRAATEDFRFSGKLHMDFQTDDSLILFAHG
jgi:hypothetical protein